MYLQALASFLSAGLSMLEFEQLSTAEKIAAIPDNYIAAVLGSKYWPQGAFYRQKSLRARGLPLCCLHSTNQNDPILEALIGLLHADAFRWDCWIGDACQKCLRDPSTRVQGCVRHARRILQNLGIPGQDPYPSSPIWIPARTPRFLWDILGCHRQKADASSTPAHRSRAR